MKKMKDTDLPMPQAVWDSIYRLVVYAGLYESQYPLIKSTSGRSDDLEKIIYILKRNCEIDDLNLNQKNCSDAFVKQLVEFFCNLFSANLSLLEQKQAITDNIFPLFSDMNIEDFILPYSSKGKLNSLTKSNSSQKMKAEKMVGKLTGLGGREKIEDILNKVKISELPLDDTAFLKTESLLKGTGHLLKMLEKINIDMKAISSYQLSEIQPRGVFSYLVPKINIGLYANIKK